MEEMAAVTSNSPTHSSKAAKTVDGLQEEEEEEGAESFTQNNGLQDYRKLAH